MNILKFFGGIFSFLLIAVWEGILGVVKWIIKKVVQLIVIFLILYGIAVAVLNPYKSTSQNTIIGGYYQNG